MAATLSDLRSVKLGSTRIERDSSAPRLLGDLDDIGVSYDTAVLHCNIENWLPLLGPSCLTFESLLVPLTAENARILMRAYEDTEQSIPNPEAIFSNEPLNQYEAALRADLLKPLQHALDQLGAIDGAACIVKTSSRSSKDAAARTGALERILRETLPIPANKAALTRDEEMMRVICEAESSALRFLRAEEVIRSLIMSERIWQDMSLAFRHPDMVQQSIVVRRWEPITIDMEFRCFLHAGRLTATPQYAYQLFSRSLLASTDAIKKTVIAFFDTHLRDALVKGGFETYIVDVALLKDEEQCRPRVIEVNPFLPTTDAALFSWELERDILEGRLLLDDNAVYPVMRVCEQAQKGLVPIPKAWKEVVMRVRRGLLSMI